MDIRLTGSFALVLLLVYLGNYLIKIGSVPLGVIIVSVLFMAIYDFVGALRDSASSDQ